MVATVKDLHGSLYELLGDPAPQTSVHGETTRTKTKETVDDDTEALVVEELIDGV
jgi:hypothetical protein